MSEGWGSAVPPERPFLPPHRMVTWPTYVSTPTPSPVAPTARSAYPSLSKSAEARLAPKESCRSALPATPLVFWVITLRFAAETPDFEP